MDSSTVIFGVLDELDSTIVIYLSCPIRSLILIMTVLALLAGDDSYNVAHLILMWNASCIFPFIVLNDKLLLTFFNELPVRFKGNISIASRLNASCVGVAREVV